MKYMGSKKRLQKHLAPIINKIIKDKDIDLYVEPFVGGANMIEAIKCEHRIGSDNNKYLIALLKRMSSHDLVKVPRIILREHYNMVRDQYNGKLDHGYTDWYIGYVGFMASYNGRFFDGGYSGHAVKSKSMARARDYIAEAIDNLRVQIPFINSVEFKYADYSTYKYTNAVIYCDIPYMNSKKYMTSKNFDYEKFYAWVREQSKDNIVLISEYDMPEDFEVIWEKEMKTNMMDTQGGTRKSNIEKLYTYRG